MKIIVLIIGTLCSYLVLRYRAIVREMLGEVALAERFLGIGGTSTFVVFLGIGIFILSLMYALGTLQSFLGVFAVFFGKGQAV